MKDKFNIPKQNESMEKKPKLYHSSPVCNLDTIKPKNIGKRDNSEDSVIFTTPSKAFASMFLVRYYDNQGIKGKNNGTYYTIVWDNEIKKKLQTQGGSIYEVDNSTFSFDENKGMREDEWVSKEDVKVLSEEKFDSALQTMIENGVVVYFIDEKDIEKLNDGKHGFDFLKTIQPENEKMKDKIYFEVEIPSPEQEYERIIQYINNRSFYKQFSYRISLPESFVELFNSEEIISEENYKKYYQEFLKDYNTERYQELYKLLQENIRIIQKSINDRFLDLNKKWGFKIFDKYKIRLTAYGVAGSYNWSEGSVIINVTNKSTGTPIPMKNLKVIVHELIHIGIEENIVEQFELTHTEKERVVDLILKKHFPEYFYGEQDRGDKRITEDDIDMENLPEAIKKYKEREYKK